MRSRFCGLIKFFVLAASFVPLAARTEDGKANSTSQAQVCENLWIGDISAGVNYSVQTSSLEDLGTLSVDHPDMLLNAAQRYARVILNAKWENGSPYKEVLDPTYRVQKINLWKAFSGTEQSGGRMIVDQFKPVDEIVKYILASAQGAKIGQAKTIKGPPGTGKTELLYILDLAEAFLASHDPGSFKYAFRWKNLKKVAALRNAIITDSEGNETLVNPGLENASVLGLLPQGMRSKLAAAGAKRIREEIDAEPMPKADLDGINQQILDEVIRHEMIARKITKSESITERMYIEMLSSYVEIYQYIPTANKDSRIVRYLGETPNMGALLMDENLITSSFFPNTALAFKFGKIPHASGGGLFFDEMWRNPEDVQNVALDLIQNGVASYGAAPPFKGDWLILTATNDESIAKASKNSATGANAATDRSDSVSMRQPIHPLQAAKVAMLMMGLDNFWMKDLRKADSKWEKADINTIYTLPDEKGMIYGPEERYALKYSPQGPNHAKAVTIAPRALTYLGLIAAATRIVIDPKILQAHKNEFSLASFNSGYVLDPEKRMQVILGELSVEGAIARELDKMREVFEEGKFGVTARDTESWGRDALDRAAKRFPAEPTLTPVVVLQSFKASLDSQKLIPKGTQTKADWILLQREMTRKFLTRWLAQDLRAIQSGDPTRVRKIYEDVARDVQKLSDHTFDSSAGETPSGDIVTINWSRYNKIREIYKRQNNQRELVPAQASNQHLKAQSQSGTWGPLYRAVEEFMFEADKDTNALSSLEDYFSERPDLSPQAIEAGQRAEVTMATRGYNKPAIRDAFAMLTDIAKLEVQLKEKQQGR